MKTKYVHVLLVFVALMALLASGVIGYLDYLFQFDLATFLTAVLALRQTSSKKKLQKMFGTERCLILVQKIFHHVAPLLAMLRHKGMLTA